MTCVVVHKNTPWTCQQFKFQIKTSKMLQTDCHDVNQCWHLQIKQAPCRQAVSPEGGGAPRSHAVVTYLFILFASCTEGQIAVWHTVKSDAVWRSLKWISRSCWRTFLDHCGPVTSCAFPSRTQSSLMAKFDLIKNHPANVLREVILV